MRHLYFTMHWLDDRYKLKLSYIFERLDILQKFKERHEYDGKKNINILLKKEIKTSHGCDIPNGSFQGFHENQSLGLRSLWFVYGAWLGSNFPFTTRVFMKWLLSSAKLPGTTLTLLARLQLFWHNFNLFCHDSFNFFLHDSTFLARLQLFLARLI